MEKCHIIHGICENKDKDTDDFDIKSLKSDINIYLNIEQIDRTHRIGSFEKKVGNRRYRPIRVRLVAKDRMRKLKRAKK